MGGCIATLRLATRVVTKVYDGPPPLRLTVSQMAPAVAADRRAIKQAEVVPNSARRLRLSRNLGGCGPAAGWKRWRADARVHTHRLSGAGRALFERVMPAWRAAQQRARDLLGEAGVNALQRFARENGFGS